MKRLLAAGVLTAAALAMPTAVAAQSGAEIALVHAIPGTPVDLVVDGEIVVANFQPGAASTLSPFSGQTLANVTVVSTGTQNALIGPVAQLRLPSTGSHSVVAHLDANGRAALSTFANNVGTLATGRARLTIRHVAQAAAVNLEIGSQKPASNLGNGSSAEIDVAAGDLNGARLVATDASFTVDIPPTALAAGSNTVIYLAGSGAAGTLTTITQTVSGATGASSGTATTTTTTTTAAATTTTTTTVAPTTTLAAQASDTTTTTSTTTTTTVAPPTAVNTGSPLDSPMSFTLALIAGGALVMTVGSLLARRKLV